MIIQDILTQVSIFCDVDDFCKQFEPERNWALIENLTSENLEQVKQSTL